MRSERNTHQFQPGHNVKTRRQLSSLPRAISQVGPQLGLLLGHVLQIPLELFRALDDSHPDPLVAILKRNDLIDLVLHFGDDT